MRRFDDDLFATWEVTIASQKRPRRQNANRLHRHWHHVVPDTLKRTVDLTNAEDRPLARRPK